MEYNQIIIDATAEHMRTRLAEDSSGHDWWHTFRVHNLGKRIATEEGADLYVVELACLLHDIADYKLHEGDEELGPRLAGEWLYDMKVEPPIIGHVRDIIATSSFKGPASDDRMETLEGRCVQDADRLDAIGAIGIARCFAFGGYQGNIIYDPDIPISLTLSENEYKKARRPQINHFYEKLLLLKDKMKTKTGREIAQARDGVMRKFLSQFFKEWKGKA